MLSNLILKHPSFINVVTEETEACRISVVAEVGAKVGSVDLGSITLKCL